MMRAAQKYGIELPDRQLCCAPVQSPEGEKYLKAMRCAVNFAFANRQVISAWAREAIAEALEVGEEKLGMRTIYEVAHNIAKIEEHPVNGIMRKLCVHRKGATRAFGPESPDVTARYRAIGQPVLIPGDMGRYSFVAVGTELAMKESWGSTCHGAGRQMSRKQAIKVAHGRNIEKELAEKGIVVRGASRGTLAEEISEAYKDVSEVVEVCHQAGLSKKVARIKPMGNIKG
jgi:tRNA-splicing ligase RtcB